MDSKRIPQSTKDKMTNDIQRYLDLEQYLHKNTKLGVVSGVFDLLVPGHILLLKKAHRYMLSNYGFRYRLVTLMNSDVSVEAYRPNRPTIFNEDERKFALSLFTEHSVLLFDEATPQEALELLDPDVYFKGEEYTREDLPELENLLSTIFVPLTTHPLHSSDVKAKILNLANNNHI